MRNRLLNQSHLIVTKRLIVTMLVDNATRLPEREDKNMAVKSKNKKNKGFRGPLNLLPGENLVTKNGAKWIRRSK